MRLANDVAIELDLELPRGHVPPLEIVLQRTEYLLLGDYAYSASDEQVRMRVREYFAVDWYQDLKKDWSDFGAERRYPKRKRVARQDFNSVTRGW